MNLNFAMMKQPKRIFANVWDAIADSPGEAANLQLRYELMEKVAGIVKVNGWTQLTLQSAVELRNRE